MQRKKQSKLLIIVLCFVLIFDNIPLPSYAFERDGHDKYMEEFLFKNFLVPDSKPSIKKHIQALESAAYLCVDQFNNNGQDDLDYLMKYGVQGLPSLNEITFNASGKTHRNYTHRGWDFVYGGLASDRWKIRKQLLIGVVGTIFDFKGNTKQQESFSALVYYIHILGDHEDDDSWKISNGLKMDVGGRVDKEDIIDELLKHFEILFANQKYSHKYRHLTNSLERYNNKLAKIVRSDGGINNDEKFAKKQKYVKKLKTILTHYLPEMLKEEEFFYNVFYK